MIDKEGVYFILRQYGTMLQDAIMSPSPVIEYRNIQRVVVCGMGGSGVVGDFVDTLVGSVVVETTKGYDIPKWASKDDLVVCVSYSGNTEETLSCYEQAVDRGCLVLTVTSGGKLMELTQNNKGALAKVPPGLPPRFATVHMLVPVLAALKSLRISEAYDDLPGNVAVDEEYCAHVAKQLVGKIPIIYASRQNMVLSEKLKTDINENAKVPAFFNVFPEFNHNELNAFEHITPNYIAVFLMDPHDRDRIKVRMRAVHKILEEKGVTVLEVPLSYRNLMYKVLHGNLMCLLIAYYLAIEYGTDPGPVAMIERFKKAISQDR